MNLASHYVHIKKILESKFLFKFDMKEYKNFVYNLKKFYEQEKELK